MAKKIEDKKNTGKAAGKIKPAAKPNVTKKVEPKIEATLKVEETKAPTKVTPKAPKFAKTSENDSSAKSSVKIEPTEKKHREVLCRGMKDHECHIGQVTYTIVKGQEILLPKSVSTVLAIRGIVVSS